MKQVYSLHINDALASVEPRQTGTGIKEALLRDDNRDKTPWEVTKHAGGLVESPFFAPPK